MILFRLLTILLLFLGPTYGQSEVTTFDIKPSCLKQHGNWRKFANLCLDSCQPQFNKYTFCAQTIAFGCDCGENRCWHENKCISKESYQKIYDANIKKEEDELAKLRKERNDKLNDDPAYAYQLHNLYPRPQAVNDPNNKNSGQKNNTPTPPPQVHIQAIPPQNNQQLQGRIPSGYNKAAVVNSNGKAQDLTFPVVPLPE